MLDPLEGRGTTSPARQGRVVFNALIRLRSRGGVDWGDMTGLQSLVVVGALSALAVGTGACGSGSTTTRVTTVVQPAPGPSSQQDSAGGGGNSDGGSNSGGGSVDSWTMPDLTGKDLQTAQDAIQSLTNDGVFFTTSHDATGQGRHQILDRDWQVCSEDPAPGSKITPDTKIDFAVVRMDTE
jgi:PASTA domain